MMTHEEMLAEQLRMAETENEVLRTALRRIAEASDDVTGAARFVAIAREALGN